MIFNFTFFVLFLMSDIINVPNSTCSYSTNLQAIVRLKKSLILAIKIHKTICILFKYSLFKYSK